jgi:hypothetical protein
MKPIIGSFAAGLVVLALASGCGGSATANTQPSYPALLASFGDAIGASGTSTVSPTPATLIVGMGPGWLAQVCQARSDATLVGVKSTTLERAFAAGYDKTASAGAPAAHTVFIRILGQCAAQGLT